VGDAKRIIHSKIGGEKKLLKYRKWDLNVEGSSAGGGGDIRENDGRSERWRWGDGWRRQNRKQVVEELRQAQRRGCSCTMRESVVITRGCTCSGATSNYRDVKILRVKWTPWRSCLCGYVREKYLQLYREKGYVPVLWLEVERSIENVRSRCIIVDNFCGILMFEVDAAGDMVGNYNYDEA
jgi:hypothetical protein